MAKIFVIEDDRGWGRFYERVFKNYELEIFHDGIAAIDSLEEPLPVVIILDLLLNGPTGFAILNELQSYPELAKVPVVIVSSVAMPMRDGEALKCYGVRRSFDKATMVPQELLAYVAQLVTENTSGVGLQGSSESERSAIEG